MTTRHGEYFIYKFYNKETNDYEVEFFLPDFSMRRIGYRLTSLADMKVRGYEIVGILKVDKEAYLNARLAKTVEEFIVEDRAEQEIKQKFQRGEVSKEVYGDTMQCIQNNKWHLYKSICRKVRRLLKEGFDVENEIALQIYDHYAEATI